MRHRKHNHQLGVKTAHRASLLANLSCSLIENGRIKTTLAKARALRPFIEKVITLAKNAHSNEDISKKIHYRRLAISRLRDKKSVAKLFDELVDQFSSRNGGYTRIYKLALPRLGDAADMALIEFVEEPEKKKPKKKKSSKKSKKATEKSKDESTSETPVDSSESETGSKDEVTKEDDESPKDAQKSTEESTLDTEETASDEEDQVDDPTPVAESDSEETEKMESSADTDSSTGEASSTEEDSSDKKD